MIESNEKTITHKVKKVEKTDSENEKEGFFPNQVSDVSKGDVVRFEKGVLNGFSDGDDSQYEDSFTFIEGTVEGVKTERGKVYITLEGDKKLWQNMFLSSAYILVHGD